MTPDQITQLRLLLNEIFAIADSGHEPDETHGLARIEQLAKQALALLPCPTCNDDRVVEHGNWTNKPCPDCRQPECETCRGTKIVKCKSHHDRAYWGDVKDCPDCQKNTS